MYTKIVMSICILTCGISFGQTPVNPNASLEAKYLLRCLHGLQGKGIISGMHNEQDKPTGLTQELMYKNGGVEPALWGNDYRYGDFIQYRQRITNEAIKQWQEGKIVTMMYHAPRPMDNITASWNSVQGDISDSDWKDIVTPGTTLYQEWLKHVDAVAVFIKQLKEANVPVLFRPYHEMNEGWFWWGKRYGENGYKKLYQNLYHRFVDHHGLNNILWVWNTNATNRAPDPSSFYPGDAYVDVIAIDVYGGYYPKSEFDLHKNIGTNKPVVIGEFDELPDINKLKNEKQEYVWFMGWRKLVFEQNTNEELTNAFANDYTINGGNTYCSDITIDKENPSTVSDLTATNITSTTLSLNWIAATDNTSISKYEIYLDDELFKTVTDNFTTVALNGLLPETYYTLKVLAVDQAENKSQNNPEIGVTTLLFSKNDGIVIKEASQSLVIDGELDPNWLNTESYQINNAILGDNISASNLSGSYKMLWDATNLYLLIEVIDDTLHFSSAIDYDNDGVELYLDVFNDKSQNYGIDDFRYRFVMNNVSESQHNAITGVTAATSIQSNGYTIEVAIPWSSLNVSTAYDGLMLGLDVHINDNDSGTTRDYKKAGMPLRTIRGFLLQIWEQGCYQKTK